MKKMFYKVVCIVLLVSSLCTPLLASANLSEFSFIEGNIEYVFTTETMEDAQRLLSTFKGSANGASLYGLACLFGHDLETGTMTRTIHNVRSTDPKCNVELYSYKVCKRSSCDYAEYTLEATSYEFCH